MVKRKFKRPLNFVRYLKNPEFVLWMGGGIFCFLYLGVSALIVSFWPAYFIRLYFLAAVFFFPFILFLDRLAGYINTHQWSLNEDDMMFAGMQALCWICIVPIYLVIFIFYQVKHISNTVVEFMEKWFDE